ncbi:hypothetical protein KKC32_04110 [Patescibacteria group bacterium]|nr:hypothetical protein [Patescibacteria group bacterium]
MYENQPEKDELNDLNNENGNEIIAEGNSLGEKLDGNKENFILPEALKRNQKVALIFIGFIGLSIIALGFIQITRALSIPFPLIGGKTTDTQANSQQTTDPADEDPAVLKGKDTDSDQINDFDEMYVYETSPYLADSDSDGISDFDEISKGEDPNCPLGQECFRSSTGEAAAEQSSTAEVNVDNISPAQLREILVSSGNFTREQVDAIDDATILEAYKQTLKDNPDLQDSMNGSPTTAPENLSVAEIKQLLLDQGVEESMLQEFDDATLKQMYLDALEQAKQGD